MSDMGGVYYTTNSTSTSAWSSGYTTTTTSGTQSMINEKDFKIPPISEEDLVMHKLSDKCEWIYVNDNSYKTTQRCRICGERKELTQQNWGNASVTYSGVSSGWGGAGASGGTGIWGGGAGGGYIPNYSNVNIYAGVPTYTTTWS